MQYGYFDQERREYVITRPDTPEPWANYLGSPEYGAIISNNAAGYSFVRSGADGRLIRYRFNELNTNLPGRYIYIRDDETGDYWTNSWQPTAKPLSVFHSECRHGTAYTAISAEYAGIRSEAAYYVPLGKAREVWDVKVRNKSAKPRRLSVFFYTEFTNLGSYEQDTVNLQYSTFISRSEYRDNIIVQHMNENTVNDDASKGTHRFAALAGAAVCAYCGDREQFFGPYRNYGNPLAVEAGDAGNGNCYNGNAVGVLQTKLTLDPGEESSFSYMLGEGSFDEAPAIVSGYGNGQAEKELRALKEYWHEKLDRFVVRTPDENFNASVNTWNAYQCFITFIWSRAASFIYCGLRNGYGYRDTVQDIQGIMHLAPEMAAERLRFMLSAQVSNGGGLPLVKFTHNAGHEDTPDDASYRESTGHPHYRSDDALWLFPTVDKYVRETGHTAFYDEVIPYAEKEEGTVYDHLKRAIGFSYAHMTDHGLPAGLEADWNDCLRMGEKGESSFLSFQLYYALELFGGIAAFKHDKDSEAWARGLKEKLAAAIEEYFFEGDRYIRAITEDGLRIGSKSSEEANIWLNPQSWAVLTGFAAGEKANAILDTVYQKLNTEYGVKLFDPPFRKFGMPVARMILFNPGTKENAGIFSQTQGWIIQAESRAGHGARAFEYYSKANPASMNERADVRRLEPYVHGQFVESDDSPFAGRAHVHWLTGTASTVMIGLVEGILGVHPSYEGIEIDPCIPGDWKGFTMRKLFRGKRLDMEVINETGSEKGVKKVVLNGERLESAFIPFSRLTDGANCIRIYM